MAYDTKKKIERAFLVGVAFSNKDDYTSSLKELSRLCETAGIEVVGTDFQIVRQITPATIIGSGKIEEIKNEIQGKDVDLVVFDTELSGSQARNLSDLIDVKVIDRIVLILDIFAQRATSNEGKLQVELAQLKYNLPRLAGITGSSGRFGSGGIGMRGPGETKLEINKRVSKDRVLRLEKEIMKIEQVRATQKKARFDNEVFSVAIVGYTNAGKSTLLNLITKASIYADDKLFATLDTTSRTLYLGENKKIVLTDTVGFISKLPHDLVDAFRLTLDAAKDANVILHIIDISNPNYKEQKAVVEKVLKDIGATGKVINVYNKVDKVENPNETNGIYISAKRNVGIDDLKNAILSYM